MFADMSSLPEDEDDMSMFMLCMFNKLKKKYMQTFKQEQADNEQSCAPFVSPTFKK